MEASCRPKQMPVNDIPSHDAAFSGPCLRHSTATKVLARVNNSVLATQLNKTNREINGMGYLGKRLAD